MKVIVTGACGRMGKSIIKLIQEDPELELIGAIENPATPFIGMDAGECAGVGHLTVPIMGNIDDFTAPADVLLDFTSPSALEQHLNFAVKNKVAVVVGTTGLEEEHHKLIRNAAQSIPAIWAPNYSVGINLLAQLTRIAAEVLTADFDVEIIEAHHRMKKDAPSGTAIKLLEVVKEALQTDDVVFGREGLTGERPTAQIGVHAVRGGDVVGDHTVIFAGIGERVELTHKATTRETLSRGALRAAKYVVSQGQSGLYTMNEVLGLEG